jgi:hypothetical protein
MTNNFPNLFIPGAAKSGTSTLHDLLHLHDNICMSSAKEPFYFVNENFSSHVDKFNSDYEILFSEKPNAIYKGESSSAYMLFPNFIERVKTHIKSKPKFIFILRNPIDRLYSHYWYLKGLGSESLNFKEAVLNDKTIEPTMSDRLDEGKFKNYFQYGLYGKWLSKFYEAFDESQIKIIVFEDLKQNPQMVMKDCFEFLGLEPLVNLPSISSNKTTILRFAFLHKYISRITNGKIILLKPINKIIPRSIKTKIKSNASKFIVNLTKTNKVYPELNLEDRKWVKDLYIEDYNTLKKITGLSFHQWDDFL